MTAQIEQARRGTCDPGAVTYRREGRAAFVTLNRPASLNALGNAVLTGLREALARAGREDDAALIVLEGAGEHGFSAGHDFAGLQRAAAGNGDILRAHRRATWEVVQQIARHPKPIVVLLRGMVLGAGAGLAAAATHRVAASDLRIALPETSLGQMPDAGLTFRLARAPGGSGLLVALTGWPLSAADAMHVGLADGIVDVARMDELAARLANPFAGPLEQVLSAFVALPEPGELSRQRALVDRAFGQASLPGILAELDRLEGALARQLLAALRKRSPLALAVTHAAIRRARSARTLEDAMNLEYMPVCRLAEAPDAAEGVRALLIDRDDLPRWSPASLAEVDASTVESIFAPMLPGEAMRLGAPA